MFRRLLCALIALALIVCLVPLTAFEAKAASAMKASDKIILYLKTMEGFTAIPRWDYVQWTVGYGNRCPDEHLERYKKEGIPIEEADALFLEQLAFFEEEVNKFIDNNNLTLNQHQFDAVLSLSYNCGTAWLRGDSALRQAIIDGTTGNTLVGLMSQWCTAGGEYLPGLMRRRLTEADMYLNGRYNTQAPSNYAYVFFDAGKGTPTALAQGFDCNLAAVPLATASRAGYTFLGWYTEPTGGVKVTYLDEKMNQHTLYAHWEVGDGSYDGGTDIVPDGVLVQVTGDVVNVRSGPGITYSVVGSVLRGDNVVVTKVAVGQDGRVWGQIQQGWLCLDYTNYKDVTGDQDQEEDDIVTEDESYRAPLDATIVGGSSVTVYNGPDTGYPKVGTLASGTQVLLVETYNMFGVWWGKLETGGWICLDRYVLLHNDQMLAHSVSVSVTNSYVNVRSGPGTQYSWLDSLNKGDVITILAVETVNGKIWGRYSGGWLSLEYTSFDTSKLEQYQNHSYGQWYNVTASTCVTPGVDQRDCVYCDHSETRDAQLGDHSFGEWYTVSNGTCVEEGQQRRDCRYCSEYELQNVGLGQHVYGQWQTEVAPTCTEAGINRRYCQYCDAYEEETVAATGHTMGQWYETVAPTLDQYGQQRRDCENCDYYETQEVEPLEHLFADWEVVQEPTCTEPGLRQRLCTDCDYVETEELPALGHAMGDWTAERQPTCTEPGLEYSQCSRCEHRQQRETEATGHSLDVWYQAVAPDCDSEGQSRRNCKHCDYYETKSIAALGHTMGQWHTITEPTCAQEGQQRRDCSACDHYETAAIDKTAHDFCDWYISIEPTYEKAGQEMRVCNACGFTETREKAFNGQVIIRIYATVTVSSLNIRSGAGTNYSRVGTTAYGDVHEVLEQKTVSGKVWGRIEQGWICLTGNTTLEETTEVIPHTHDFGQWYTAQEATCTENGSKRRDCACGHYETEQIPATGHSFGAWYTVTEPTAEADGLQRRDCANCDHYETQALEYVPTTVTKIYGTLTGNEYLNIREGLGTNYAIVGKLYYGERVEILEISYIGSLQWGRIDRGWIQLTGYMTLEEVEEPIEHDHVYGDWFTHTQASCTTDGEMRRECSICGEYETQVISATGHSFGEWYTVTAATATQPGLQQRDCQNCDHAETKEIPATGDTVTKIFATITVSSLNVRSGAGTGYSWVATVTYGTVHEVFEQKTVSGKVWGRIEKGWICLTGYTTLEEVTETVEHTHSFGDWYTVTAPTATQEGLQRRDCACGHYETQVIPATGVKKVYATILVNSLTIRSGAGTGYSAVGYVVKGQRFEVLEQTTVGDKVWGRIDKGWICLTGYTSLEEVSETEGTGSAAVYMKVNAVTLNVRSGAGTGYGVVTSLAYGTQVQVLETKVVNGVTWARIAQGWVSMDYLK